MHTSRAEILEKNYHQVMDDLKGSKARLLVVSKTQSIDDIKILYGLGQRDFGENRVQELEEKALALALECPDIQWHMIGNLQTNKVPKLSKIPNLVAIHSVDREELLLKLMKEFEGHKPIVGLFLQINTSHEEEKSGFEQSDNLAALLKLFKGANPICQGLMTMGTIRTEDIAGEARRCFSELHKLRDQLNPKLELSMGMSGDYQIALEFESDWVRVGSRIFH